MAEVCERVPEASAKGAGRDRVQAEAGCKQRQGAGRDRVNIYARASYNGVVAEICERMTKASVKGHGAQFTLDRSSPLTEVGRDRVQAETGGGCRRRSARFRTGAALKVWGAPAPTATEPPPKMR